MIDVQIRDGYAGVKSEGNKGIVVRIRDGMQTPLEFAPGRPHQYNWGYLGGGPSTLAKSILNDYLDDEDEVDRLNGVFKETVIAAWDMDSPWELSTAELDTWLDKFTNGFSVHKDSDLALYRKDFDKLLNKYGLEVEVHSTGSSTWWEIRRQGFQVV